MNLDLSVLKEQLKKETENESAQSKGNSSGANYPLLYLSENGKLTVRLLYNIKSNIVQRRVVRHNSGKTKVPCLQTYGEECPVCQAISEAQTVHGKQCGAFTKYGYKIRGICYAQIVDHDISYFSNNNKPPKKGDIVLLMYPKTVYDQLNKFLTQNAENLDKILAHNEGFPIMIERSMKGNGFPEYNISICAFTPTKVFEDDSDGKGEDKFEDALNKIPALTDVLMPNLPTDEVRVQVKALAQTITQEYMKSNIVNPSTQSASNEKLSQAPEITPDIDSSVPECFGQYDNSTKCLICPNEYACSQKAGK